ncbi:MAG: hypothetical protein A2Y88_07115 [Chloroflexi bacterium RBG_13_48_10]|nr:MAG: hypothetical protein A2Y88_07115 [Chloroflexi bacterium RBG_13_48_10]
MAEGDALVLNNFKEQLLLKQIDCDGDTFMVALYSVALASPDGAPVYTATNEIAPGGSYSAGGQSIGVPVVTQDDTNNWGKWDDDGSDVTWAALPTATILEARLYDDTTTPKHVCILWEIATNSNGGDYTLQFGANGMMTLG